MANIANNTYLFYGDKDEKQIKEDEQLSVLHDILVAMHSS